MKKLERMKEAKQRAYEEQVEEAKKKAEEKGLGFVEYELPPDDVDEEEVRRTLLTSLRAFIPYTQEWYEALAAEEDLDNLKRILKEKSKVHDLYTMSKMGRHEEALDMMMSETNYDFFYFNKLKYKMELEGKFNFETPNDSNLFRALDSKGGHRNRLKKAINQVYNVLDQKMTDELARLSHIADGNQQVKKYGNDQPCIWRGKNKQGETVKCENGRMRRPEKRQATNNADGIVPAAANTYDYFPYCSYHVPFCVNIQQHEIGENIKIRVPNVEGLCAECFMQKFKKRPPPLTSDQCPGISLVTLIDARNINKIKTVLEKHFNETSKSGVRRRRENQCTWEPDPKYENQRGFECINDCIIDPATGRRHPFCAWHMPRCIRPHLTDNSAAISVPNMFGMCAMHYLSEQGHPPPVVEFPFPGTKKRLGRDFWKYLKNKHFAAPKREPPPIIIAKPYKPPVKYTDLAGQFKRLLNLAIRSRYVQN